MRFFRSANKMAAALQCLAVCLPCLKGASGAPIDRRQAPLVPQQPNAPAGVPDYVIKYAPLVYLDPSDAYMPSDIGSHIIYSTPRGDKRTALPNLPQSLDLTNLDLLNNYADQGKSVYLTSNDDFTQDPAWIKGVRPDASGKTGDAISAAVIVADKGNGLVDVFYFYYFIYNRGATVLGQNLGNHMGDWEHNMVRFQNGVPQALWYSQHSGGQSFAYKAVQKDAAGLRPIVYSARGSHANYGLPGPHDYTISNVIPGFNLPGVGLITDNTGTGPLWDPIKSAYWYTFSGPTSNTQNSSPTRFDSQVGTFRAYDEGTSPVGWLYFQGKWGDQQLPKDDKRQKQFFGQWKFTSGPSGPAFKNLVRRNVWPGGTGAISPILLPRDSNEQQ